MEIVSDVRGTSIMMVWRPISFIYQISILSGLFLAHHTDFPHSDDDANDSGHASAGPHATILRLWLVRSILGIPLAGQVVAFCLPDLFPTSGHLGSWLLELLGISGLESSSASNPPTSPGHFSTLMWQKLRFTLVLLPQIMGHQLLLGTRCLNT